MMDGIWWYTKPAPLFTKIYRYHESKKHINLDLYLYQFSVCLKRSDTIRYPKIAKIKYMPMVKVEF